jgi:hypothetical protein
MQPIDGLIVERCLDRGHARLVAVLPSKLDEEVV